MDRPVVFSKTIYKHMGMLGNSERLSECKQASISFDVNEIRENMKLRDITYIFCIVT